MFSNDHYLIRQTTEVPSRHTHTHTAAAGNNLTPNTVCSSSCDQLRLQTRVSPKKSQKSTCLHVYHRPAGEALTLSVEVKHQSETGWSEASELQDRNLRAPHLMKLIDRLLSTSSSASQPAVNTFCILSGYITDTANIYYHSNLLLPDPSFGPWHLRKLFTGKDGNCWLYFLTNSPKIFNSTANSHISDDGTVNIGYLWSDIRFQ